MRVWVVPRRPGSDLATADHIQVAGLAFPLTKRGTSSRLQRTFYEGSTRQVVGGWVARLEDAPTVSRFADLHTTQDHDDLFVGSAHGWWAWVIPDRLLTGRDRFRSGTRKHEVSVRRCPLLPCFTEPAILNQ